MLKELQCYGYAWNHEVKVTEIQRYYYVALGVLKVFILKNSQDVG